jgi:hypothetical protein
MLIGRVRRMSTGFMKVLRMPRTIATTKAVANPSTLTDGESMYADTNTAIVLNRSLNKILIL